MMKRACVVLAVGVLAGADVSGADNFSGTWKLNTAKSKYSPGPPPQSGMQKIEAVDNGIKVVADIVNAQGQKQHTEFTVKFDGKDYSEKATRDGKPNPNAPDTVSVNKIDDYTWEVTQKKNGKVRRTTRDVVSKDGKTRTWTRTGTNGQGQPGDDTLVWEKQ